MFYLNVQSVVSIVTSEQIVVSVATNVPERCPKEGGSDGSVPEECAVQPFHRSKEVSKELKTPGKKMQFQGIQCKL